MAVPYMSPRQIHNSAPAPDVIDLLSRSARLAMGQQDARARDTLQTAMMRKAVAHDQLIDQQLPQLESFCAEMQHTIHLPLAHQVLQETADEMFRHITRTNQDLTNQANAMVSSFDAFHTVVQRNNSAEARAKLERDKLITIVRQHPMVCAKNRVALDSHLRLVFTTNPIMLRPNTNPYKWIQHGEIPVVNLGKLAICFDLRSGDLRIYPASRGANPRKAYAENKSAHPHLLSGRHPCIGDFGPPLAQAIADRDYALALDVIFAFLSQAATSDPAGATWVNWVLPEGYNSRNVVKESPPSRPDGRGLFVAITADGTITHKWQLPVVPDTILPGITPPVRTYQFWDGRSIPKTGEIVRTTGGIKFIAWKGNTLFFCENHPASAYINNWQPTLATESMNMLPIPADQHFSVYSTLDASPRVSVPHQFHWDHWDHDYPKHPHPRSLLYFTFAGRANFTGTVQLNGPMSRDNHISVGDSLGPDTSAAHIICSTSFHTYPPACAVPLQYYTKKSGIRIGQLAANGYMIVRLAVYRGQVLYTYSFLPWQSSGALVEFNPNRSALTPEWPLHGISKFCADTAMRQVTTSKLAEFIQMWRRMEYTENNFEPWLWEIVRERMVAGKLPEEIPPAHAANQAASQAANAVRVEFANGQYFIAS